MRVLLVVLAIGGGFALFMAGAMTALDGFTEQGVYDKLYVVGFAEPGSDCGKEEMTFNVADGEPLFCAISGSRAASGSVEWPGFADGQNKMVEALAARLGSDGLSAADQRQIQDQVDEFAATVPPAEVPRHTLNTLGTTFGLWGASRGWLGVGMMAVPALAFIGLLLAVRLMSRR